MYSNLYRVRPVDNAITLLDADLPAVLQERPASTRLFRLHDLRRCQQSKSSMKREMSKYRQNTCREMRYQSSGRRRLKLRNRRMRTRSDGGVGSKDRAAAQQAGYWNQQGLARKHYVKAISDTGLGFDIGRTRRLDILIQFLAECGDGGSQQMESIVRADFSPDLMS